MENMEIWRDIPGYEGRYQVSNTGKVKSLAGRQCRRDKILVPGTDPIGHKYVCLCVGGIKKYHLVHRLVMTAFVGPCPEQQEVCHNNSVANDNRLSNLRYDTRSGNAIDTRNCARGAKQKLTVPDVLNIRMLSKEGVATKELARKFGVCESTVRRVVRRDSFAWID